MAIGQGSGVVKSGLAIDIKSRVRCADDQRAARFDDPAHFAEQAYWIGDLLEAVPDEDAIEAAGIEAALLEWLVVRGVAVCEREVRGIDSDVHTCRVPAPLIGHVQESADVTPDFEHSGAWRQQRSVSGLFAPIRLDVCTQHA